MIHVYIPKQNLAFARIRYTAKLQSHSCLTRKVFARLMEGSQLFAVQMNRK